MIDWLEEHIDDGPALLQMSQQVGYSPQYCSAQFHEVVGMTIRNYLSARRLARAALEVRDTEERILDIAVRNGYSSQEALTRAFVSAYGCTPAAYRRKPQPVAFTNKKTVLSPKNEKGLGGTMMSKTLLTEPHMRMEYIPAHKYLGIWDDVAVDYPSFWERHDCELITGLIESMRNVADPVVGCHVAGWRWKNGVRKYFYGLGVPADYQGAIPEGFSIEEFPASYYLAFCHPPFDYFKDCGEVMRRVEDLAWNYDIDTLGFDCKQYAWNEEACQDYQRHYPEVIGYEVLRPVVKK